MSAFETNPELAESLAVFNETEQTIDELYERVRGAAERKRESGLSSHDRVTADMDHSRFSSQLDITKKQVLPENRNDLQRKIVASDMTDIEKAVYGHALKLSRSDREERVLTFIPTLEALDEAAQEGSWLYYDRDHIAGTNRGRFMGSIAESGLKVRFDSNGGSSLGFEVDGLDIFDQAQGGFNTDALFSVKTGTYSIANLHHLGGHWFPSIGGDDATFAIGQNEFDKLNVGSENNRDKRVMYFASRLLSLDLGIDNPYTADETERIKNDILKEIEAQARGTRIGDSEKVHLMYPSSRRDKQVSPDILSATGAKPELLANLCRVVGLEKNFVNYRIDRAVNAERQKIIYGEITGETWSELEIADQRLPYFLSLIFDNRRK